MGGQVSGVACKVQSIVEVGLGVWQCLVLFKEIRNMQLGMIFHLEHILEEVILLLLALPEPAQHQLTEIREINQTFPGLVIIIEQYK